MPVLYTETAFHHVSSIYEICMFGNGTVKERDKRLVRAKLMPSYIQTKWIRFNKFGLNQTKVENAVIMLCARSTTIALDLVLLPLAASLGQAQIQIVPIVIQTAKLFLVPISKQLLQETLEKQFDKKMFEGEKPEFLVKSKEIEEFIVQTHRIDFTLRDSYLEILKKFTTLPMLNYIFFHSQMTDEYILYRKKFLKKENIKFSNLDDMTKYFKTIFRMMRFYHHSEIHALNYFFYHAFERIMGFYANVDILREKYISTFYSHKAHLVTADIQSFLSRLNHKIQMSLDIGRIQPEICPEAIEQFRNFYYQFFFGAENSVENLWKFIRSPESERILRVSYDDSVKLQRFYAAAEGQLSGLLSSKVTDFASPSIASKTSDFLTLLLHTITNVSAQSRIKQVSGSLAIIGIVGGLAALIGGITCGIKYKEKVLDGLQTFYRQTCVPLVNFVATVEKRVSDLFHSNSQVVDSSTNRVLGSILFVASHIPNVGPLSPLLEFFSGISSFNPLNSFIIRTAEDYTKTRLEKKDTDVLHRVDRSLRLAYNPDGTIGLKIFTSAQTWISDFDVDYISDEFLVFMTQDFARVVRHQSQMMGILFEQIAILDREIETFEKMIFQDVLYTHRDETGPQYISPMCRITEPVSAETAEMRSKKRFFDIIIERQTLLVALINRSYYVKLYNLFIVKLKSKCHELFVSHLPFAFKQIEFSLP